MGVTIFYRGRIDKVSDVDKLTDEVADFSGELGWEVSLWREDWSDPDTATLSTRGGETQISGELPLRGIQCLPHAESESFSLLFTREGYLADPVSLTSSSTGEEEPPGKTWLGVKTQFAPLEVHITLVKLLKYLQKAYIHNLEVKDGGGYWGTGDIEKLKCRRDKINFGVEMMEKGLKGISKQQLNGKPPEEIADLIEEILKDKFGE